MVMVLSHLQQFYGCFMSSYTATWNMKGATQGDTISPFAVILKTGKVGIQEEGTPIIPTNVCCQIRDERNHVVHSYNPVYTDFGRIVFPPIPPEVSRRFRPGVYRYDVEFTLPNGNIRTYLKGTLRISEDTSRCR